MFNTNKATEEGPKTSAVLRKKLLSSDLRPLSIIFLFPPLTGPNREVWSMK